MSHINGRKDKPRTGSEAVLLRESTAPNADRIARLEAHVANLEREVAHARRLAREAIRLFTGEA